MCRWLGYFSFSLPLISGCQSPPSDHVGNLIKAIKDQRWEHLEGRYLSVEQLNSFPLKSALDRGAQWVGVTRIRKLEQYLLFDIDLKEADLSKDPNLTSHQIKSTTLEKLPSSSDLDQEPFPHKANLKPLHIEQTQPYQSINRYHFWVTAPRPPIRGDNAQIVNSQTFSGPPIKGELATLGKIAGWSVPQPVTSTSITISDIQAPSRFTARSYRTLSGHERVLRHSQEQLGVIGLKGSGAIEPGWRGHFQLLKPRWTSIDSKRKRCQRALMAWKRSTSRLMTILNQSCHRVLLQTAQRTRYFKGNLHQPQVDVTRDGGGRNVRIEQEQLSTSSQSSREMQNNNGVSFNGRISLRQSLDFKAQLRPTPSISEAMIIAPPLTQCLQQEVQRWSAEVLPRSACEIEFTIHFKVLPQSQSSSRR